MLKAKDIVNYRRGTKNERCLFCKFFVLEQRLIGISGADLGVQPRCRVIGLKPGRMYRVDSGKLCDRFNDKFGAQSA